MLIDREIGFCGKTSSGNSKFFNSPPGPPFSNHINTLKDPRSPAERNMLILHLIFCKFTWPQNPSLLLSLFNLSSSHFLALHKRRILEKTPRSSSFPGVPFYACCSGKIVKSTSFHSYVSQFG